MKNRIFILLAATTLVIANSIQPASAQQNIKGFGVLKCGEFLDLIEPASETESAQLVVGIFSWFQGYATGKNLEREQQEQKDLTNLLPDDIVQNIANLCSVSTEVYLYQVAEIMYQSLPPFAASSV